MIGRMVSAQATPASHSASAIRVLIVDNDGPHAEAVAESLTRVGYDCTVATFGPEGARLIERNRFDLVITDLMMNDVDGLGILARAKTTCPTPR